MRHTYIYRTSEGGIDMPFRYCGGADPVEALERFARDEGISDFSIDQDGPRLVLCPAHSRGVLTYYTYAA